MSPRIQLARSDCGLKNRYLGISSTEIKEVHFEVTMARRNGQQIPFSGKGKLMHTDLCY